MALPLLPILGTLGNALKIPSLAIFLGQIASNILGWFAIRMTRSLAINLTILTLLIGLAGTIATTSYFSVMSISYVTPPYLNQAFAYFVPNNAIPCMSCVLSARVLRWLWAWQFYAITKVSS